MDFTDLCIRCWLTLELYGKELFFTILFLIVAVKVLRQVLAKRAGLRRKPIPIQPALLGNQERSSIHLTHNSENLLSARDAKEAFLTVDLCNGDVVSFPADIHSAEPGEVDVDTSLHKRVVQSLDGELGERINVIDALEMSKMVHLIYVFPDERMMAIPIAL